MEANANPLLSLLRLTVVRIETGGGFQGSGFFVAPDEVLTCAHVVAGHDEVTVSAANWSGEGTVVARFPESEDESVDPCFYPFPDVALLRVSGGPAEQPCVRLDPTEPTVAPEPDVLYLYGYSRDEYEAGAVAGSPASVEFRGLLQNPGFEVMKLGSDQVLPGFSGCPALNLRTGSVCAMIDSTRDRNSDLGGFAIPVAAVAKHLPELLERNRRHHEHSDVWRKGREAEEVAAEQRAGAEALPLLSPTADLQWTPDLPQSELLRPRYRVVGLVGREGLLGELMLWRESDHPLRVSVVAGGGGFGKTRLALEVCERARRAGWTAGLLSLDETADTDRELQRVVAWPGRSCIAIDYAEAKPAIVSSLIRRLLRRTSGPSVRLILICRQAQSKRELEGLFALGEGREEVARILTEAEPIQLDQLEVDRRLLFEQAVAAFSAQLGRPSRRPPRPSLQGEHFSRVLFVLAAALLVAQDPNTDIDSMGREELLIELIDRHERQYWQQLDESLGLALDPAIQRRAVAAATVLGANDEGESLSLVGFLPGLEGASSERRREVASWLSALYGSGSLTQPPAIGPVEPDMLGEALVRAEYTTVDGLLDSTLDHASDLQLARGLVVLSRAAGGSEDLRHRLREALDERLPDLVAWANSSDSTELDASLDLAVGVARPLAGAGNVLRRWKDDPMNLGVLSRSIAELGVEHVRNTEGPESRLLLAQFLVPLGSFLIGSGRLEEARAALEESVGIYRERVEDGEDRLLELTTALRVLITVLNELEDADATLERAQEQVEHARVLAERDDSALPDLAGSLVSLSSGWGKVGRPDQAREAAAEAVRLYRDLKAQGREDPSALATALSNLSVASGEMGERRPSLEAAEEAVELRQALFEEDPEDSRVALALGLNNLSVAYTSTGMRAEALAAIEEAVRHYRVLAKESPRYRIELATMLANLGDRLHARGDATKALPALEEAVDVYKEMAVQSPDRFLPNLTRYLSSMSAVLSDLGRREEALSTFHDSVELLRQIVDRDRERFLPALAEDLNNLAAVYSRLDRPSEASGPIEEAVGHYRELVTIDAERHRPKLAMSLANFGIVLGELGKAEEALAACDEAIAQYRVLEQKEGGFHSELGGALNTRATQLSALGKNEEALEATAEATRHYRILAEQDPKRFLPLLAGSLNNAALLLMADGPSEEALEAIEEGLAHRRRSMSEEIGEPLLADFALLMKTYAGVLTELGRMDEARQAFESAVEEQSDNPECWNLLLAKARWHREVGEWEEAMEDGWAALERKGGENGGGFGKPRLFLRGLRDEDQERFDRAWRERVQEYVPLWLRYPKLDEQIVKAVALWLKTPDWEASRSFLEDESELLLSDPGQATLEHMCDLQPLDSYLLQHLGLLRAARAEGVAAPYELMAEKRAQANRRSLLVQWLQLSGDEAKDFLEEHSEELLHQQVERDLLVSCQETSAPAALVMRLGFFNLVKLRGIEDAYELVADRTPAPADETCLAGGQDPEILALSRFWAGAEPYKSDRHFQHALAAAAAGQAEEAEAAIDRCRDSASSWDRRDYLRRLDALAQENGEAKAVVALRERLKSRPSS